jgi:hypothetical protein
LLDLARVQFVLKRAQASILKVVRNRIHYTEISKLHKL